MRLSIILKYFHLIVLIISATPSHIHAQIGIVTGIAGSYNTNGLQVSAVAVSIANYHSNNQGIFHIGAASLFMSNPIEAANQGCIIKGSVHAPGRGSVWGTVYLIDSIDHRIIDSSEFNPSSFEITGIAPGTYHLLASPNSILTQYLPTYYANYPNIQESTAIPVRASVSEIGSIDITLQLASENKSGANNTNSIHFYPNPVQDALTFILHCNQEDILSIKLTDSYGRVVSTYSKNLSAGYYKHKLLMDNLNAGMYVLSMKTKNSGWENELIIKL